MSLIARGDPPLLLGTELSLNTMPPDLHQKDSVTSGGDVLTRAHDTSSVLCTSVHPDQIG